MNITEESAEPALSAAQARRAPTPWYGMNQVDRIAELKRLRDAGSTRAEAMKLLGAVGLTEFCIRHKIDGFDTPRRATPWNALATLEDKAKAVAARVAEKKSLREIALDLGVSENTIRGFLWRRRSESVSNVRIRIERRPTVADAAPEGPPPEAYVTADPVDPRAWEPIHGEPVTLEQNAGCCWPIDTPAGQRFCGAAKARGSARGPYCPEHHSIAYRPRKHTRTQ